MPNLFWGNFFGNYCRKLYSIKFLGELINVMQGLVVLFLGNHKYFGYSYSFSLCAVWELITVMQPRLLQEFILSEYNM